MPTSFISNGRGLLWLAHSSRPPASPCRFQGQGRAKVSWTVGRVLCGCLPDLGRRADHAVSPAVEMSPVLGGSRTVAVLGAGW